MAVLLAGRLRQKSGPIPQGDVRHALASLSLTRSLDAEEQARWSHLDLRIPDQRGPFVDWLLAQDDFNRRTAPYLVMGDNVLYTVEKIFDRNGVLKRFPRAKGEPDRHGLYNDCPEAQTVAVRPWWDPEKVLAVCPDSYKPEVIVNAVNGLHCSSDSNGLDLAAITFREENKLINTCGCGPSLMRCFPDEALRSEAIRALRSEVAQTIAYATSKDLPVSAALDSAYTFRTRLAEFTYQRARVESGESKTLPSLQAWPEQGAWAPRPESFPGQHAGVLTSSQLTNVEIGNRALMRRIYEQLWCSEPSSSGVSTESVLALGTADTRKGERWHDLATMPICNECHARLDFGAQFFNGYPDIRKANFFSRAQATPDAEGPLYGRNYSDPRGSAKLTPKGFVTLALAQPEFGRCMSQKIGKRLFGSSATPNELEAIRSAFQAEGKLRPAMRVGLLAYLDRVFAPSTSREAAARPSRVGGGGGRAVSAPLRNMLDAHCLQCHADDQAPIQFVDDVMSQAQVLKALTEVAFGGMPKEDRHFSPDARQALVKELLNHLGLPETEAARARTFFLERMETVRVPPYAEAENSLLRELGLPPSDSQAGMVGGDLANFQLSPGILARTALEASEGCRKKSSKPEAYRRCLEQHLVPQMYFEGPAQAR
jgi:hypothetical protein